MMTPKQYENEKTVNKSRTWSLEFEGRDSLEILC